VGLDFGLAADYRCAPGDHRVAREVSEGAAFVFDSALGLALLGGIRRVHLAAVADRQLVLQAADGGETLIARSVPQNIAHR
jgi:hypothetical protein